MKKITTFFSFISGYWTHVFCLSLIVIGMPFSKFLMSLGTISLIVNWFIEGGLKKKFISFFRNKTAVFLTGAYLIFMIGMLYSNNVEYGLKDLRIKIPLLAFPVVLSTAHRLKKSHYFLIVRLFTLSVIASSVYGFLVYQNLLPAKKEILELRDISQFISHIRLSLMIVLSLFLIPKLFTHSLGFKIFGVSSSLFLLYFLSFMESGTGLVLGFITLFFISLYYLFKKKNLYGFFMLAPILIAGTLVIQNLYSTYHTIKIDTTAPSLFTKSGSPYDKNYFYNFFDNGNYAKDFVCEKELTEEWSRISTQPFYPTDSSDGAQFILIRYLTSRGLKKDREGMRQLTEWDIKNIEAGIPNYLHARTNIVSRLHRIMFELDGYLAGVNASGNSFAQRLEYWKVSKEIVKEKPWFGYGTGDVADVFEKHYQLHGTNLEAKYQLRSHNQYLSTAIAVGIVGLAFFLFCLLFPIGIGFKQRNYFYLICLCISILSFFSEDTLETQDGVFFFTFLTNFFLFSSKNRYLKSVD